MNELRGLIVKETANSICMSLPVAYAKFRKLFHGLDFKEFFDPMLSVATHEVKIDIGKFDDFLHEEYSDYETDGLSMKEFLSIEFGPEAAAFLYTLL
jgi:hypothetical protein